MIRQLEEDQKRRLACPHRRDRPALFIDLLAIYRDVLMVQVGGTATSIRTWPTSCTRSPRTHCPPDLARVDHIETARKRPYNGNPCWLWKTWRFSPPPSLKTDPAFLRHRGHDSPLRPALSQSLAVVAIVLTVVGYYGTQRRDRPLDDGLAHVRADPCPRVREPTFLRSGDRGGACADGTFDTFQGVELLGRQ